MRQLGKYSFLVTNTGYISSLVNTLENNKTLRKFLSLNSFPLDIEINPRRIPLQKLGNTFNKAGKEKWPSFDHFFQRTCRGAFLKAREA